jgi:4-hydroxybenzoate polyprenyltransferase
MKEKLKQFISLFKPIGEKYQQAAHSRYGKLIRMSSYHVYPMLFLPTWCAIWIADLQDNIMPRLFLCLLFAIGAFLTRSAGCIINDIADIKFDAKVDRTKNRPLVTGEVGISEAIVLAAIMLGLGLIILILLPSRVLYIAVIAFLMMLIYPLSKRFTNIPQLVLGLTFNLGVLVAWLTVSTSSFFQLAMLYIGFVFLTFGYDTIYACQDIEYDKEAGIKSFPLFIQSQGKDINNVVWHIYKLAFVALGIAGLGMSMGSSFYLSLAVIMYITSNSLDSCNVNLPSSCAEHFKTITLVLIILFCGVAFAR